MSTTNEIWLPIAGHLERLDLDEETQLLPSFQANDRTKPESIQSDYSAEFSVPGTAANHRRLRQAASSQPAQGAACVRVNCVLTSGGVETLPLGLLYIKGFKEGRYYLQLSGGNRRFVEALGEKKLADLDLSRFNHTWDAAGILSRLPYGYWDANGYGYELYDRGRPLDLQAVDPFTLYPSVAGQLIWNQLLTDAGFTADSLTGEALFAQSNIPTANPFTFPQDFRDARALQAGFAFAPLGSSSGGRNSDGQFHGGEFPPERLDFSFTSQPPYHGPTAGATYVAGRYRVDTLGYYDLSAAVPLRFGCRPEFPGQVSCNVMLYVNGQPVVDGASQQIGIDSLRIGDYQTHIFTPKLTRHLLRPTDEVTLEWQGDEWEGAGGIGPTDPYWQIALVRDTQGVLLPDGRQLLVGSQFTATLLPEFPHGGLVELAQWLPDMLQLDFAKTFMLLLGLTIQTDDHEPHLHLAPGTRLLENVYRARNWTGKRDAYAAPGRQPERDLSFRFGSYGQTNWLKWTADAGVTAGYGDGRIVVADEVLPTSYDLATLPFAASEPSPTVAGLLLIRNFEAKDITAPTTLTAVEAQPRLVLRDDAPALTGQLIVTPASGTTPAVKQAFTTSASYFASVDMSLLLGATVLGGYWSDLRAMLDQARALTEYYRLTPRDIAELDYSIPVWDGVLGDYFAVSSVGEYDARRPVEVHLVRLNAAHLPAPVVPGDEEGQEFYGQEFYTSEFY